MTKEELQEFCSTDRATLRQPWSVGEFTYATDGRILIEVPRLSEIAENPTAPKLKEVLDMWKEGDFVTLHEVPDARHAECEECDGDGEVTCDCQYTHPCDECDGKGEKMEVIRTQVGKAQFNNNFLLKILKLPNLLACTGGESEAMSFKFDGGRGLLMPIK